MGFGNKAAKLLTNKYLLYFIVFISAINILGYIVLYKLNAVIFFGLVGFITYQFSKNMTVVLLISLLMTNLFMVNSGKREGLENQTDSSADSTTTPSTASSSKKTTTKTNTQSTPIDVNNIGLNSSVTTPLEEDDAPEPFENSSSNKKNTKNGSSSRIDYASTLEGAYDNLDKILGSDGIKNLTKDTQNLMAKQQELFQTMQSMTPMLSQAKEMIKGFDMKSLEGLAGLATNFTSSGLATPK